MSEPGLVADHLSTPEEELTTLLQHQFPGAIVDTVDGQFVVITIHGVGPSYRAAIENALKGYRDMQRDGQALPQIIRDIEDDLRLAPGMSRARHDSLMELLDVAEQALNDGTLTKTVPWIMIPSYTRQIEELRRRTSMRLMMVAQEMKAKEDAKKRAGMRFPRPQDDVQPAGETAHLTAWERMQVAQA